MGSPYMFSKCAEQNKIPLKILNKFSIMDLQSQLRQFKDFLQLYNIITEHCFKNCVNTVLTRDVEDDEVRNKLMI